MARLFEEHLKRSVKSLDGAWRFLKDPNDDGIAFAWYRGLDTEETTVVPSVWNTERGNLRYEGVAWYEKRFFCEGGTLRFVFEAVMTDATVWLDSERLGEHYGGFSSFDFTAYDVFAGWHTLTVRVDNRFDAHSIPQKRVDWYHYGGIIRSVSVETLKGICALSSRLEHTLSENLSRVSGSLALTLCNATDTPRTERVCARLDSFSIGEVEVTLMPRERRQVVLPTFEMNGVELWDVDAPRLYELSIQTESDDLFDRVGFRLVEVKNGRLLLNRREVEIRGVNRHEEYPDFGFAFPPSLMRRDIDLIVEMGCNAIRGSHYPNSKLFLDMLDARGILFWSEIPIWGGGFSESALADPVVVERGLTMHREMVEQYFHHPCIVLWGMHNEILTRVQAAYDMTEKYYAYLKENGGNRAVVYATDKPWDDICMELCDIICLNQYYGWYYGYEDNAWERFLERFEARTADIGLSDKGIIMSEFGCAGLYGCHDEVGILWSEEDQAEKLGHALQVFHDHPRVIGSFIWQFADIRTCLEAGISRARGFNNKGIVNEYRKPKMAYFAAKEKYLSFAKKSD